MADHGHAPKASGGGGGGGQGSGDLGQLGTAVWMTIGVGGALLCGWLFTSGLLPYVFGPLLTVFTLVLLFAGLTLSKRWWVNGNAEHLSNQLVQSGCGMLSLLGVIAFTSGWVYWTMFLFMNNPH